MMRTFIPLALVAGIVSVFFLGYAYGSSRAEPPVPSVCPATIQIRMPPEADEALGLEADRGLRREMERIWSDYELPTYVVPGPVNISEPVRL